MVLLGGSPHAWLLGGLGLAGLGLYLWLNWTPGVPIPSAATAPGAATTDCVLPASLLDSKKFTVEPNPIPPVA